MLEICLVAAILLIASAFFSASETSITGVSEIRMHKFSVGGNLRATKVMELLQQKDRVIGAVLMIQNGMNVCGSVFISSLAHEFYGRSGVLVATSLMTVGIILLGELLPKSYAVNNADKVALVVSKPLSVVISVFSPIVTSIMWINNLITKIFFIGRKKSEVHSINIAEELKGTIDFHHTKGQVEKYQKDMLGGVLELHDTIVAEIMVHRRNIFSVNIENEPAYIIEHLLRSGHNRVPVWRENQEEIIGVLSIKDILRELHYYQGKSEQIDLLKITTPPWFVPKTTTLKEQLEAFRKKRSHFALVIDEYGDLEGLITIQDILEEIVGQFSEGEGDKTDNDIIFNEDGSFVVSGMITVKDLNRSLDLELPDDDASTIAGLIIHNAEKIPDIGEEFEFYKLIFVILEKQDNQLKTIKIIPNN